MIKKKDIDYFLMELERFVKENEKLIPEEDLLYLTLPFKWVIPKTNYPKWEVQLPILTNLIQLHKKWDKWKTKRRTSNYLRRAAYALNYIEAKGFSYREIFIKILQRNWNNNFSSNGIMLVDFYSNEIWTTFIIPDDYWIVDRNYLFNWDYKISKDKI